MERKLQERLVGAGVLILALVIVGPMILDGGPPGDEAEPPVPGQRPDELHTQTFSLNEPTRARAPEPGPAPTAVPAPPTVPRVEPSAPAAPPVAPAAAVAEQAPPAPAPVVEPSPPAAAASPRPSPEPAAPAAGGFVVQVGTFGQKDNAERLVRTLKGRGFAAQVSPTSRGGKTLYRVRVGPAGSREAAAGVARELAAAGHPGQVVAQ